MEDILHERGIDVSHEAVRFWWNRFGPMFAAEACTRVDLRRGLPIRRADQLFKGQDRRKAALSACAKPLDRDDPVTEVLTLKKLKILYVFKKLFRQAVGNAHVTPAFVHPHRLKSLGPK